MKIFELKDDKLIFKNEIKTLVNIDNFNFDEKKQEIIGAGFLKLLDYLNFVQECQN